MPKIEVIQFHLPNRRREVHQIELPENVCNMFAALKQKGFAFEVEENGMGIVWSSIINHSGPDGPLVVDDIYPRKNPFTDTAWMDSLIEKAHDKYVLGVTSKDWVEATQ